MDKLTKLVANGRCPNANCDLDGDIQETETTYSDEGWVSIGWECDCGAEWHINYQPCSVVIDVKPNNYKQIEEE